MTDRKELQLIDAETSRVHVFHLSDVEYTRDDVQYRTQLLCNAKASTVEERSSSVRDRQEAAGQVVAVEENEATEENETAEEATLSDGFRWVDAAVRLLLAEFKKCESFRRKFRNSARMSVEKFWETFSTVMGEQGYKITGPQCESKCNGLKKTYKSVKDHNGKSGNNRRSWPYFEIMDDMLGHKPWASPTHILDSATMSPSSPACSSNSTSGSPLPGEGLCKLPQLCANFCASLVGQKVSHESSLEKLILNVQQSREDRKKMHEDAMARQDRLLALFERIAEK